MNPTKAALNYRQAKLEDIPQLQLVRNSVVENVLSDPSKVTDEMVADYINNRGKGWVCESEIRVIGFTIVDLEDDNVWALFLRPEFEGMGIGKALHNLMLQWYFEQGKQNIWLSTEPKSRADRFYRLQGWIETGIYGSNEIRFEMSSEDWKARQ